MKTNRKFLSNNFILFFALAFLMRISFAITSTGFTSDIACFGSWACRVFEGGFSNFYTPDVFTDYPPGYMYVLYIIGAILSTFRMDIFSPLGLLLLKLPSILTDMAAGYLLYHTSQKYTDSTMSLIISGLYLFNPAVLMNSVIWGQVDSVLALFVMALCLFMQKGRTISGCFIFAAGVLFKPQMLVFAPVLLYGIYEQELLNFKNKKQLLTVIGGGLCALLVFLLAMMPFGLSKAAAQFTDTLGSYPYASVNAYNFWGALGLNWTSQDNTFYGISYKVWGTLAILLITIASGILFELLRRKNQPARYMLTAAFLIISTFTFSVRMHERYLYPAMFLLLMAYVFCSHRSLLFSYILISAFHFINVWHVLNYYTVDTYDEFSKAVTPISIGFLLCVLIFYISLYQVSRAAGTAGIRKIPSSIRKAPAASRPNNPVTKLDWLIIFIITISYSIVAFTNLGYHKAPQTEYLLSESEAISLEFAPENVPAYLCYYLKYEDALDFDIQYGAATEPLQRLTMESMFSWGQIALTEKKASIVLHNNSGSGTLGELVFLDENGEITVPLNKADYPLLFDEEDTLPDTFDFRSTAYFDEIYYNRVIHEFTNKLPTYENTHPPLGKIFMWLGTLLFGMNPFGFRFMGTLFGAAMLPFLYLLARNLLGNRIVSAMVTISFAFDFMHFTQTRVATIDVYIVFFIIMMYFFMERYLRLSFYDTPLTKTFIPLGACGIMFGLGISCKWTGFYAGAGLAVLLFASIYKRYQEYKYACLNPETSSKHIKHAHIIHTFVPYTLKTLGFCVILFVLIPAVIYLLSYIPFRDYSLKGNLVERMLKNQITMYEYHSSLTATHPYASPWYQWPTMVRPVFYYSKKLGNGLYQGISAFGNPMVWFPAIPACIYTLYRAFLKRKFTAWFLGVGFLAMLLPWTLVTRCTFLYHYFPCVPFLVLMLGYTAMNIKKRMPKKHFYMLCAVYTLAVIGLFVMFYPVISGMPVSGSYVDTFLRWSDKWVLILK